MQRNQGFGSQMGAAKNVAQFFGQLREAIGKTHQRSLGVHGGAMQTQGYGHVPHHSTTPGAGHSGQAGMGSPTFSGYGQSNYSQQASSSNIRDDYQEPQGHQGYTGGDVHYSQDRREGFQRRASVGETRRLHPSGNKEADRYGSQRRPAPHGETSNPRRPTPYDETSNPRRPPPYHAYGDANTSRRPATYGETDNPRRLASYGETNNQRRLAQYGEISNARRPVPYGDTNWKRQQEERDHEEKAKKRVREERMRRDAAERARMREERMRREAEMHARREAAEREEQQRREREERIRREKEEQLRREREEKLRKEREEKLRKDREERLRREREEQLRKEREERMRKEREEEIKKEREEKIRKEREEKLRKEREEKIRKEKEEKMRKEREERIRKEREEKIRREREERIRREREEQIRREMEERFRREREQQLQREREEQLRREEQIRRETEERVRREMLEREEQIRREAMERERWERSHGSHRPEERHQGSLPDRRGSLPDIGLRREEDFLRGPGPVAFQPNMDAVNAMGNLLEAIGVQDEVALGNLIASAIQHVQGMQRGPGVQGTSGDQDATAPHRGHGSRYSSRDRDDRRSGRRQTPNRQDRRSKSSRSRSAGGIHSGREGQERARGRKSMAPHERRQKSAGRESSRAHSTHSDRKSRGSSERAKRLSEEKSEATVSIDELEVANKLARQFGIDDMSVAVQALKFVKQLGSTSSKDLTLLADLMRKYNENRISLAQVARQLPKHLADMVRSQKINPTLLQLMVSSFRDLPTRTSSGERPRPATARRGFPRQRPRPATRHQQGTFRPAGGPVGRPQQTRSAGPTRTNLDRRLTAKRKAISVANRTTVRRPEARGRPIQNLKNTWGKYNMYKHKPMS